MAPESLSRTAATRRVPRSRPPRLLQRALEDVGNAVDLLGGGEAVERDGDAPAPRELGKGRARAPRPRTPQGLNNRLIPARLSMLSVCHRLPSGAAASGPIRVPPRRFCAAEKVSSHPRRSRPTPAGVRMARTPRCRTRCSRLSRPARQQPAG